MKQEKLKPGLKFELAGAAFFQSLGFFVRRGVRLAVAASTADVTDVDILALRYSIPLFEERVIADCKYRRKLRPFQRILWTLGLRSFTNANRAIVVLPQTPWQAREFAYQAGVEILGTIDIENQLNAVKANYTAFGEASEILTAQYLKCTSVACKNLLKLDLKLRQILVVGHAITNVNGIIQILVKYFKNKMNDSKEEAWLQRYICYNAAVVACVMLVRFAIEAKWLPEHNWIDYAKKKLTYGDIPPKKAQKLAKLALDHNFANGLPAPQYADEIIELLKMLIAQPEITVVLPYIMDFILLGVGLQGIDKKRIVLFTGEKKENAFKAVRRILSVIAYAADLPSDIWSIGEKKETSGYRSKQHVLPLDNIPKKP